MVPPSLDELNEAKGTLHTLISQVKLPNDISKK